MIATNSYKVFSVLLIGVGLFLLLFVWGIREHKRSKLWNYVRSNDVANMRLAIASGDSVNFHGDRGNTLLHIARTAEMVDCLVSAGADVNAVNDSENTPLHLLSFLGHWESVELLVQHGAAIDLVNEYGCTPLYCAASGCLREGDGANGLFKEDVDNEDGKVKVIVILLKHGANINFKNPQLGDTALYRAVESLLPKCTKVLLANGANPNLSSYGEMPLDVSLDAIKALPNMPIPIEIRDLLLAYGAVSMRPQANSMVPSSAPASSTNTP